MDDLSGLFDWLGVPPAFTVVGEYFTSETPPDLLLTELLGLDKDDLKPFTQEMLESLRDNKRLEALKRGFRAYSQFQDILEVSIRFNQEERLWNRNYCYYESLVYLRESIVVWLDRNALAAMALLRPFLELAVLHIYWYLRCEGEGYADFYQWLEGKKGKPPFRNQLEEVFVRLPSTGPIAPPQAAQIKYLLHRFYRWLSTYNHSPKVDESITGLSGGLGRMSLDSFFYFLASVNLLLRQIVHLYVLAYPMSMFPVERYRKWGVGGPVGIYFDHNGFSVLQAYLGKANVERIRSDLLDVTEVKSRLEGFERQPDLSDAELEMEWQRFIESSQSKSSPGSKPERIAMSKAHSRGIGWALNYIHRPEGANEIPSSELERLIKRIEDW